MFARSMLLGAGMAVLMSAGAVAPAEAAPKCRGFVQATAEGTFKYPTELISRNRWRGEVKERYGNSYAFWSSAEEKSTRCYKSEPGEKWTCLSRARPCD